MQALSPWPSSLLLLLLSLYSAFYSWFYQHPLISLRIFCQAKLICYANFCPLVLRFQLVVVVVVVVVVIIVVDDDVEV